MALIATIIVLAASCLAAARRPAVSAAPRCLTALLGAWLFIYAYTEFIGYWNYSPAGLLVISTFYFILSLLFYKKLRAPIDREIANNDDHAAGGRQGHSIYGVIKKTLRVERILDQPLVAALCALLCLLLVTQLAILVYEVAKFSPLRASDTFSYHLPTINSWVAYGGTAIQPNLDYRIGFWPHAAHSIYGLVLMILGSPKYVGAANLVISASLWVYAVYFTLGKLGFTRLTALTCAYLSTINTVWFVQAGALSTDVTLAGLLVLSIGLAIVFIRDKTIYSGLTLSLSLALLTATKHTGMVFAGIISLLPIVSIYIGYAKNEITLRKALQLIAVGVVLIGFVGGFTYWRNMLFFGNPFYPAEINFLSWTFQGSPAQHLISWYYDTNFKQALLWTFDRPLKFIFERPQALGFTFTTLIKGLPVLLILAFLFRVYAYTQGRITASDFRSIDKQLMTLRLAAIGFLILCVVIYRLSYINPLRLERYLYFATFIFFIPLAWTIEAMPGKIRYLLTAACIVVGMVGASSVWTYKSLASPKHVGYQRHVANLDASVDYVQSQLGKGATLIIKKRDVQIPYYYLAKSARKTYIVMAYGPNFTDPFVNIVDQRTYQSIWEFIGRVDKHSLRAYNTMQGLNTGATYLQAFLNEYCIVNIISTVGEIHKIHGLKELKLIGKFGRDLHYKRNADCSGGLLQP